MFITKAEQDHINVLLEWRKQAMEQLEEVATARDILRRGGNFSFSFTAHKPSVNDDFPQRRGKAAKPNRARLTGAHGKTMSISGTRDWGASNIASAPIGNHVLGAIEFTYRSVIVAIDTELVKFGVMTPAIPAASSAQGDYLALVGSMEEGLAAVGPFRRRKSAAQFSGDEARVMRLLPPKARRQPAYT